MDEKSDMNFEQAQVELSTFRAGVNKFLDIPIYPKPKELTWIQASVFADPQMSSKNGVMTCLHNIFSVFQRNNQLFDLSGEAK